MRDADLPLLAWQPPSKILVFPVTRRVGKIRRCAEVLGSKHGKDAESYWRQQVRVVADHLERMGCSEADIKRQIDEFQRAVQAEMVRRSYGGNGGAA
ncbi:hypothetical protein GOC07_09980 [Sinorhizobium meliloti]|nr:hypothetical protein [Sinorhizobium meliloti]